MFSHITIAKKKLPYRVMLARKYLGLPCCKGGSLWRSRPKTLTPTERRYAQIENECLAMVFACQRFSQYLARREKITVESDYKPLQAVFKKSILVTACRLQRMLLRLQCYNLDVQYKPGSQMYIDHLPRVYLPNQKEQDEEFQVFALEVEALNPFDSLTVSSERLASYKQQSKTQYCKL